MNIGGTYPRQILNGALQKCSEFATFLGRVWTKIPGNERISSVALKVLTCALYPSTPTQKVVRAAFVVGGLAFVARKVYNASNNVNAVQADQDDKGHSIATASDSLQASN